MRKSRWRRSCATVIQPVWHRTVRSHPRQPRDSYRRSSVYPQCASREWGTQCTPGDRALPVLHGVARLPEVSGSGAPVNQPHAWSLFLWPASPQLCPGMISQSLLGEGVTATRTGLSAARRDPRARRIVRQYRRNKVTSSAHHAERR